MWRICGSALIWSAFSLAAWAGPLQITPDLDAPLSSAPEAAAPPPAPRTPVHAGAAQSELGGRFIALLFGGVDRAPPPADQPAATASPAPPPADARATIDPNAGQSPADAEVPGSHPPLDPKYERQVVAYTSAEPSGTIVIDTPHKFLYLIESDGKALRYGIGVGRQGFTWAGVKTITAKREWPDWRPPEEMIKRQPELPRFMAGGPQNPLGARALYLGSSLYRIHGSNEPWTIGHNVSSGCIRMRNADVIDLYNRVSVGTKVVVM